MNTDIDKKDTESSISSRIRQAISNNRSQFIIFLAISSVIFISSVILFISGPLVFQPYFGSMNPLLMITVTILLGVFLFVYFLSRGWFVIFERENLRGLIYSCLLAIPFAIVVVLLDFNFPWSEDINVLLPESLLFYPTMGFVVEILFHTLPLAVLLLILTFVFKNVRRDRIILVCIIIISVLEPLFQAGFDTVHPTWFKAIDSFRLFLFSFVQLKIFERYDFVSMYSFRLVYYLIWHILWGTIRLTILF